MLEGGEEDEFDAPECVESNPDENDDASVSCIHLVHDHREDPSISPDLLRYILEPHSSEEQMLAHGEKGVSSLVEESKAVKLNLASKPRGCCDSLIELEGSSEEDRVSSVPDKVGPGEEEDKEAKRRSRAEPSARAHLTVQIL